MIKFNKTLLAFMVAQTGLMAFAGEDFSRKDTKLGSVELNIVLNNKDDSEVLYMHQKEMYSAIIPKTLVEIQLCDKSQKNIRAKCVELQGAKLENTKVKFIHTSSYDKRQYIMKTEVENYPADFKPELNFDLKKILAKGLGKGIAPEKAVLVITPVTLVKKQAWTKTILTGSLKELDKEYLFPVKVTLEYKKDLDKTQTIDLFSQQMHRDIGIDGVGKLKLSYSAFDNKYKLFNPPLMVFQNRIRQQLVQNNGNTLKDYLALTVAFNLTRMHPAWKAISNLLNTEKETGVMQNLSENVEIISLKKDEIFGVVLREPIENLANQYILQTAELSLEIAEYEQFNAADEKEATKAKELAARLSGLNIPSSIAVSSGGQLSYQEKLSRYIYYSKIANDSMTILDGASTAGSNFLNSILR